MITATSDGEARWEIDEHSSHIVRQIFDLVGNRKFTLSKVTRELHAQGIPSPRGNEFWNRTTIHDILNNPAYSGRAQYGRERLALRKPGKRAKRGDPKIPRRAKVAVPTDPSEQITIPVPAIISDDLFERVKIIMDENRRQQRQRESGPKSLLSGLLVCGECGSAFCGRRQGSRHYYRCLSADRSRATTPCNNGSVKARELDDLVWRNVCDLLQQPERLAQEVDRRCQQQNPSEESLARSRRRLKSVDDSIARLIDAHTSGLVTREEFESRMPSLRSRLAREAEALRSLERDCCSDNLEDAQTAVAALHSEVGANLADADPTLKRDLLELLVKRIEIHREEVRLVYKVPTSSFSLGPGEPVKTSKNRRGLLHHCQLRHAVPSALKDLTPNSSRRWASPLTLWQG